MISTSLLTQRLKGDWVVFDKHGQPLDVDIPSTIGPATLLVTGVTDAVKRIDGEAVESVDREQLWSVEAIVLNRVVLERLDEVDMSAEELLETVRELGYGWQISPTSAP